MTARQIAKMVKKGTSFKFEADGIVFACKQGGYPIVQLPMSAYETMSQDALLTANFVSSEEELITFVFIESSYYAGNFRNAWMCFQEALEETDDDTGQE